MTPTTERTAPARAGIYRLLLLVRDPGSWVIFASASSLIGTVAVTSLLGFAYWWAAARFFATSAVGFAAAGVSAMNLLGSLSMLGFGTLLIGELPRHRDREWAFLSTALLVTGVAGAVLGVSFALVAPALSRDLEPLRRGAGSVTLFAAGVALTSTTNVLDLALVGMLRGRVQLWRNTLFSVSKLVMVVVLAVAISRGSITGIYVTWILGTVVSLLVVVQPIIADRAPLSAFRPDLSLLHGLRQSAAWHHVQNLSLQLASLALPLIVIVMLSATQNAYFYTTWLLAGFVFFPPYALTIGLYTIGAREPQRFARYMRITLAFAGLFSVVSVVVVCLGAGLLLRIFGHDYETQAAWSLRIVVIGVFPLIIKDHFVACCRVRRRIVGSSLALAAGSLLGLAAGAVGAATGGLVGLTLAWLIVESLQAVVFVPTLVRSAFPAGWRSAQPLEPERMPA